MRYLFILFLTVALQGCVSKPNYGNFSSQTLSTSANKTLISDTVKQLQTLYPPAKTRFNLGQSIPDSDIFGKTLVATLRDRGYAVQEFNPKQSIVNSDGLSFRYIVDTPVAIPNFYRITVMTGSDSLSRAYIVQNNVASPAGEWTYKGK